MAVVIPLQNQKRARLFAVKAIPIESHLLYLNVPRPRPTSQVAWLKAVCFANLDKHTGAYLPRPHGKQRHSPGILMFQGLVDPDCRLTLHPIDP